MIIWYFPARTISQETSDKCLLVPISMYKGVVKYAPPEEIVSPVKPWIWTASAQEW